MEVGPEALLGPVKPCVVFLIQLFGWHVEKLQAYDLISLIAYDQIICHMRKLISKEKYIFEK